MSKRPVLNVKPREGRRARAGAPWIFSNEIVMPQKGLEAGTVVDVKGDDGQIFGSGFFNPKSLIAVRLLGRELGLAADEHFFTTHFKNALNKLLAPKTVILRNDAPSRALEGLESYVRVEQGTAGRIAVEENGARYFADLGQGQKTGWYYDQRDNRALMA